ncbi:cyclophane-forming radical SAM/SPASM peptide maturase GrrM/OscB [Dyella tabacisoli]|uniref:GRRM system radical SAM/SPASM domain protein n=1 Tax=Dyella tabacisoli TaxID=2282381 RepID=A0A369UTF8_9GAMM|nr:cyclophane-forming radical SAM/SPASM peptide maturase GrrM/OscB [Dyella tabacisoli]RDD82998.1 GRRM system radical SAM/SPASM domain protein [Dyella tabacisoli]
MKPRLLILQASSLCNLNCTYCYVPHRQDKARMSEATLRAALRLLLSGCDANDSVRILWHAGEPLAAGLEFYKRASDILRECNPGGVKLSQAIQTNGTLIDEPWCRFFVREKIVIGLSVDGPAMVHDRHRRSLGNGPTHAHVMRGAGLLRKNGIPLHAIAVLSPYSLDFADEIFDFFVEAEFRTVGFNLEETDGVHASTFAGEGVGGLREKYQAFMSRLFDRWQNAGRLPKIREFEGMSSAIAAFLRNHRFTRTADDLVPFHNIAVTREGEISTFSPELASGTLSDPLRFSIGNVHRIGSLDELVANKKFQALRDDIGRGIARCRSECEYFAVCGGGTASNKFYEHGTFDCTETTTCALHRKTLTHVVADGLRKLSVAD